MQKSTPSLPSSQQGIVLLESLVAILIFSFAVLGIVGLQAAMVKNTAESKYISDASYVAQQQIGMLWTDVDDLGNSLLLSTPRDISTILPGGSVIATRDVTGLITVTVTWTSPGDPQQHRFITTTNVSGA